jgi:hypothetical protein
LHSAQIKKSDDLGNACAKSLVLEALLAQAVAMQIISTPGFSGFATELVSGGLIRCSSVNCVAVGQGNSRPALRSYHFETGH